MIERQFITQKLKEHQIQEYILSLIGRSGYSHTEIKRTPLGERIVIYTSRPGLVVGRKGENIKKLTLTLKNKFKMENPQIEIGEVPNPFLDPRYVAERIVGTFENFGSKRFKSTGYRMLQSMIDAGALGGEIVISGKVPSARAKKWRFSAGYMKKSGDIAMTKIKRTTTSANIRAGTIGIKVSIMTPDILLPDRIIVHPPQEMTEATAEQPKETAAGKEAKKKPRKAATPKKRAPRKKKEAAPAAPEKEPTDGNTQEKGTESTQ